MAPQGDTDQRSTKRVRLDSDYPERPLPNINELPTDALLLIFQHAVAQDEGRQSCRQATRLVGVCRLWRDLLYASSFSWTDLAAEPVTLLGFNAVIKSDYGGPDANRVDWTRTVRRVLTSLPTWLARSGSAGFSFALNVQRNTASPDFYLDGSPECVCMYTEAVFSVLAPHTRRMQSLSFPTWAFGSAHHHLSEWLQTDATAVRSLRSLHVMGMEEDVEMVDLVEFGEWPEVVLPHAEPRQLSLLLPSPLIFSPSQLAHVSELLIRPTHMCPMIKILLMLRNCPRLKILRVCADEIAETEEPPVDEERIQLQDLMRLRCSGWTMSLLDRIHTPRLNKLDIELAPSAPAVGPASSPGTTTLDLNGFLERCRPCHLVIRAGNSGEPSTISENLPYFRRIMALITPTLKSLEFIDPGLHTPWTPMYESIDPKLLKSGLPTLEEIAFHYQVEAQAGMTKIGELAIHRQRVLASGAPLSKLRVTIPAGILPGNLWGSLPALQIPEAKLRFNIRSLKYGEEMNFGIE